MVPGLGLDGPRHAPPLRMRLRCWYDVVIGTAGGKRIVLREEGLRGGDARTMRRAIERWRDSQDMGSGEPVEIRELRMSKKKRWLMPEDL